MDSQSKTTYIGPVETLRSLIEELARQSHVLRRVFHAGRFRIHHVDASKLQGRDEGYYGKGFYVSDSAKYVKTWYGPVVTAFNISADAKILWASVDWDSASYDLQKTISAQVKKLLRQRGKESEFNKQIALLKENQIEWVHQVDMYAEDDKYDIVCFNSDEIVVKNLKVLKVAWTGSETTKTRP